MSLLCGDYSQTHSESVVPVWVLSIDLIDRFLNYFSDVWFLSLIAYQPLYVILCQSYPPRRTVVVLFNP